MYTCTHLAELRKGVDGWLTINSLVLTFKVALPVLKYVLVVCLYDMFRRLFVCALHLGEHACKSFDGMIRDTR